MRAKVFTFWGKRGSPSSNPISETERVINSWLSEHPHIKVVDITQSSAGGDWAPTSLVITLWYEEPA